MSAQLELDFSEDPSRPVFPVLPPPTRGVPGCPRCEGKPGDLGLCHNHHLDDVRARERRWIALNTISREEREQDRGIIETMKRDILAAAAASRPMPWRESEDMTANERRDFQRRIFIAMRETGTVIVAPPTEEIPRPRRKRAP